MVITDTIVDGSTCIIRSLMTRVIVRAVFGGGYTTTVTVEGRLKRNRRGLPWRERWGGRRTRCHGAAIQRNDGCLARQPS